MRFHPLLLTLAASPVVFPNAAEATALATLDPGASSPSPPRPPTATSPLLTVHEGFLSSEEISSLLNGAELDPHSSGTYYGPAVLPPSIAGRLRDLAGTGTCATPDGDDEDGEDAGAGVAVMTMLMEETTDSHRDCHVPQSAGRVVEDDVAFVFLSSAPRAAFVHGDGDDQSRRVAVEAGTLVRFRGSVPHRTVVPPGSAHVRIAGPFHLSSTKYVGSCQAPCETASDCKGGAFFSSCKCAGDGDDDDRNRKRLLREGAKERAMGRLADLEAGLAVVEAESSARKGFLRNVVDVNKQGLGRELQCLGTCVEATAACILPDGTCYDDLTPHQCGPAYGGVFQGGSLTCANNAGIPDVGGACCFSGRAGFRSNPGYCEIMTPGFYAGDGTVYPDNCPPFDSDEYGACCFRDFCKVLPPSTCSDRGGVHKGDGSSCSDDCEGACCGGTKGCEIVTVTGANSTDSTCDGTFQGAGTDCDFDGCPAKCVSAFQGATDIPAPTAEDEIVLTPGDTTGADNYKDTFPACNADAPILTAGGKWYNLEIPGGRRVTVSTCAGDMDGALAGHDTSLSIYTGSDDCSDVECAPQVEGGSDSPNCQETGGSTYSWCVPEGASVTYRIMVHGYSSGSCSLAEGSFTLGVRDDGPCDATSTSTTSTTTTPPDETSTTLETPTETSTSTPLETTSTSNTPETTTLPDEASTTLETPTETSTSTTMMATSTSNTPETTTTAAATPTTTTAPAASTTTTAAPTTTTSTSTTTTTTTTTCLQKPLGTASDYNIFIKNDFLPTAADACKAVAVGGDAILPVGWSAGLSQDQEEFPGPETEYACSSGTKLRLTFYAGGDVVVPATGSIVGGLVAGSIAGDSSPGEKDSPSSSTPFTVSDCAVVLSEPAQPGLETPPLPDIDGTFAELEALGQTLKGLTDEPPVKIEEGGVLTLDASGQVCGTLKAFNVNIQDVADIGYSIQIKLVGACLEDTFLINWLGPGTSAGEQLSATYYLTDVDETRVFNNFPDATELTLAYVDWRGAFLAPKADIDAKSGAVWGQIVGKSWTGDAEIECGDFLGNFCP